MRSPAATLGWFGIARLGLVQLSLGAIVVLAISTLNRIMVVEYALPATVPGALVALHYAVQMLRPRLGHGSDIGGRRTPWIVGGMALLALGCFAAALATGLLAVHRTLGLLLEVAAYGGIGLGAGAAGTAVLVLLAKQVAAPRRAAAATVVWIMMIAGFGLTSGIASRFLDPYSPARLAAVVGVAVSLAFALSVVAIAGVERVQPALLGGTNRPATPELPFARVLGLLWRHESTRRFTLFVFVSMLAFSAEELLLEPFGGVVFGLTPGGSARLSGAMHGGSVLGMLLVAVAVTGLRRGSPRSWVTGGCLACAGALVALGLGGLAGGTFPVVPVVFVLGVANGAYAIAAIGSMLDLAGAAGDGREGVRMGLWGGAQAIAQAAGGVAGTAAIDLLRPLMGHPAAAYACVFTAQAVLFTAAALISRSLEPGPRAAQARAPIHPFEAATASALRGDSP